MCFNRNRRSSWFISSWRSPSMSLGNVWKPLGFDIFRWLETEHWPEMDQKPYMNFHTWNNQRFTSMEYSRMKLLIYLHCFQNFGQLKILTPTVYHPECSAQWPQSSFQRPVSRAHCPQSSFQHPQRPKFSVMSPLSRVQDRKTSVQNPESSIERPEFSVQHLRPEPRNSAIMSLSGKKQTT